MKNKIRFAIAILGWLLLASYLLVGYVYKEFTPAPSSFFEPVAWENQVAVFDGAISCSLTSAELQERRTELKTEIFAHLIKKEEINQGFIYYFNDEEGMAENITELMLKEKACCPFFKFDLSILPFKKGIALKISGSKAVKELLQDFESENS